MQTYLKQRDIDDDACLYILKSENAVIHVDYFAIFHNNQELCDATFSELNK